jgi:hypothetical protein
MRAANLYPTGIGLPGLLDAMSASSLAAFLPGQAPPAALAIARGTTRQLHCLGYSVLGELTLPSGRRADLVGLGAHGEVWIVEIKSSIEDYRADHKWMEYRAHCDRLFFAAGPDTPSDIFPSEAGLIVADAFGAAIVREAPRHPLHASRRKTMMLAFARSAALRLSAMTDPQADGR